MRKWLFVCCSVIAVAVLLKTSVGRHVTADEKPAKTLSAKELGKVWRYPGTGNEPDKNGDQWVWEFNGTSVDDPSHLNRLVSDSKIGSTAVIGVYRDGRKVDVKVPITTPQAR